MAELDRLMSFFDLSSMVFTKTQPNYFCRPDPRCFYLYVTNSQQGRSSGSCLEGRGYSAFLLTREVVVVLAHPWPTRELSWPSEESELLLQKTDLEDYGRCLPLPSTGAAGGTCRVRERRRHHPPPLRTGCESFPSSGSSRYKAPRERSRLHDGLNPGLMAMDAELLVERTVHKIRLPLWVKRVGVLPDFDMTPDLGFARIH